MKSDSCQMSSWLLSSPNVVISALIAQISWALLLQEAWLHLLKHHAISHVLTSRCCHGRRLGGTSGLLEKWPGQPYFAVLKMVSGQAIPVFGRTDAAGTTWGRERPGDGSWWSFTWVEYKRQDGGCDCGRNLFPWQYLVMKQCLWPSMCDRPWGHRNPISPPWLHVCCPPSVGNGKNNKPLPKAHWELGRMESAVWWVQVGRSSCCLFWVAGRVLCMQQEELIDLHCLLLFPSHFFLHVSTQ